MILLNFENDMHSKIHKITHNVSINFVASGNCIKNHYATLIIIIKAMNSFLGLVVVVVDVCISARSIKYSLLILA